MGNLHIREGTFMLNINVVKHTLPNVQHLLESGPGFIAAKQFQMSILQQHGYIVNKLGC